MCWMTNRLFAAPRHPATRSRRASGSLSPVRVSLLGKAVEAATLVGLVLLVPRALGPHDYGRFAVALSVVALAASSLTLGGPTLLTRFVPATAAEDRLPFTRALVNRLLRLRAVQVLGIAVVAAALVLADPGRFPALPTALLALAVVAELGATFGYQVSLAMGHTTLWSFRYPLQNTILCGATLGLYAVLGPTGALAGILLASAAALALGAAVAAGHLRGVAPAGSLPTGLFQFGLLQGVGSLFSQVSYRGVPVAAALLAGSSVAAGYASLAAGIALAAVYAVWQAFAVELPRLAEQAQLDHAAAEVRVRRLALTATLILTAGAVAAALLVGWALPLVLGEQFAAAVPAFGPALAILPLAAASAVGSQVAALRYQPHIRALSNAAGALAFVVTALALVPSQGAPGATAALLAAVATTVVVGAVQLQGAHGRRLLALSFAGAAVVLAIGIA